MNRHKLTTTILFLLTLITLICFSIFLSSTNYAWAQTRDVVVVYFEPDVDGIGPGNKEKVKSKVDGLNNIDEYKIILEGYSDITGRADYNLRLSKERAQLVKDYLVELGVDSNKIEAIGKGGTDKYATGETDDALARNRRVNLIIEIPTQPEVQEETPELQDTAQDEDPDNAQEEEAETAQAVDPEISTISLNDISGKIERAIRQSVSNGILLSTPQDMKIGEAYTVEAEVSYAFIEKLSNALDGFKLGNQIGLMLSGNDLDIVAEGLDIKTVTKDSPSNWRWDVTPRTPGINSLVLSVAISSETAVLDDTYTTYRRIIDVQPNMIHSITSSYWIMGIMIVLIIVIVAWILTRRVKVN